MTRKEALNLLHEFFTAVEHCDCVLTGIEVSPEIYQAIKRDKYFKNGSLWTAKVTVSERPDLKYCSIKSILKSKTT